MGKESNKTKRGNSGGGVRDGETMKKDRQR